MKNFFYTTLRPDMYHGRGTKPPFFEGWYYKLVDASENYRFAFIPGIILGEDAHAFIQVFDGVSGSTAYHRYPLEAFEASDQEFRVRIADNEFKQNSICVNINHPAGNAAIDPQFSDQLINLDIIQGELHFSNTNPWPVSLISPGIMGWYSWVPFMECYHGVVSLDHSIQGSLHFGDKNIDFTGGRGYTEKDWGKSFPDAWIWFQCNHFNSPGTSVTASVATIPWLGGSFRGFIVGLWHEQRLYRFATYNRSRIDSLEILQDRVKWSISNSRHKLILSAKRVEGGLLKGPTRLEMDKRVVETLNARVEVRLMDDRGDVIFESSGRHAGLEVHNTLSLAE